MAAVETVAWVRPPEPIRGLDHLGVQAPCTALFGQLLPGITNATDRARYYAFHPWVLWSFEKRYKDHSIDEFRRVLRRAECLFALIAIRHARKLGDSDDGRHGKAMVGREKLLRIEEASDFSLDEYAALEGPNRYFKNKLGGLGQYYFGPLRDLRVLDHSPAGAGPRRATIGSADARWPRLSPAPCQRMRSSASWRHRHRRGMSSTTCPRSARAVFATTQRSTTCSSTCSWPAAEHSSVTAAWFAERRSA